MDDRDLVRSCLSDDPQAWREFIGRFDPFLRRRLSSIATRRGLPLSEADQDDILAKVWQDLLLGDRRLLRVYDPGESLSGWILTIATRRFLHFIWARGRQGTLLDSAKRDGLPAGLAEAVPAGAVQPRELEERIARALDRLPARERFAVRVFYWSGWPHLRIARVLRIPVNHVGPLLLSARKRLQDLLNDLRNGAGIFL